MSDTERSTGSGGPLIWVLIAIAVIAALVVLGPDPKGNRFDLRSAESDGSKAFDLVASDYGFDLQTIGPRDLDGFGAVIVPTPEVASVAEVRVWSDFARAGGTLILIGPSRAGIGALAADEATFDTLDPDQFEADLCDMSVLTSMGEVDVSPRIWPSLAVGPEDRSCIGDGQFAAIVDSSSGDGRIITLGDSTWVTNAGLRDTASAPEIAENYFDTAAVLLALLSATGEQDIGWVQPDFVAAEPVLANRTFWSFVRPSFKAGLLQLVIAIAFFAWYRMRRLGRVASETLPVTIAGSELVDAVGDLMRRRKDPGAAATIIRARAVDDLARTMGMGVRVPPELVSRQLATVTGRDESLVLGVLVTNAITNNAQLLDLARQIDTFRTEAAHGPQRIA